MPSNWGAGRMWWRFRPIRIMSRLKAWLNHELFLGTKRQMFVLQTAERFYRRELWFCGSVWWITGNPHRSWERISIDTSYRLGFERFLANRIFANRSRNVGHNLTIYRLQTLRKTTAVTKHHDRTSHLQFWQWPHRKSSSTHLSALLRGMFIPGFGRCCKRRRENRCGCRVINYFWFINRQQERLASFATSRTNVGESCKFLTLTKSIFATLLLILLRMSKPSWSRRVAKFTHPREGHQESLTESGCVVCMFKSLMHTFWRLIDCWKVAGLPLSSMCEKHFRGSEAVFISSMAKATVPEPFWTLRCLRTTGSGDRVGERREIPLFQANLGSWKIIIWPDDDWTYLNSIDLKLTSRYFCRIYMGLHHLSPQSLPQITGCELWVILIAS